MHKSFVLVNLIFSLLECIKNNFLNNFQISTFHTCLLNFIPEKIVQYCTAVCFFFFFCPLFLCNCHFSVFSFRTNQTNTTSNGPTGPHGAAPCRVGCLQRYVPCSRQSIHVSVSVWFVHVWVCMCSSVCSCPVSRLARSLSCWCAACVCVCHFHDAATSCARATWEKLNHHTTFHATECHGRWLLRSSFSACRLLLLDGKSSFGLVNVCCACVCVCCVRSCPG